MLKRNTKYAKLNKLEVFKMKKSFLSFILTTVLLGILLFACSGYDQITNLNDSTTNDEELSLDKAYGGFDTNDEPVAFGDTDLLNDFSEDDAEVDDEFSKGADVTEDLNSSSMKAYFLRITWGYLEGSSDATEVINWSGSAEVNKGTLVIFRTILFEKHDYIHLPRTSRKKIDFTSYTLPHYDGIAIAILDNEPDMDDVEGTLTFNAGEYSKVLTFDELESLELVEQVGTDGHEVSIMSKSKEVEPFAGGFLDGRWLRTNPHGGIFKGRWINSIGTNAGYLKGIWGVNWNGDKVFYGKYINFNGVFGGLLAGKWEPVFDINGGIFEGHWVNRTLSMIGVLKGHYRTGFPGDGRGFFHGCWRIVSSIKE